MRTAWRRRSVRMRGVQLCMRIGRCSGVSAHRGGSAPGRGAAGRGHRGAGHRGAGRGATQPSRRRTISAIHAGANGDVQFGGVG